MSNTNRNMAPAAAILSSVAGVIVLSDIWDIVNLPPLFTGIALLAVFVGFFVFLIAKIAEVLSLQKRWR